MMMHTELSFHFPWHKLLLSSYYFTFLQVTLSGFKIIIQTVATRGQSKRIIYYGQCRRDLEIWF